MTDDATLTDFLEERDASRPAATDAEESAATAAADSPDRERAADGDEPVDGADSAVEPAASTYAWGSYECASCGASVERVWRAEAGFVCETCKPW